MRDYTGEVSPASRPLKFLSGHRIAEIKNLLAKNGGAKGRPHYDYVVFARNTLAKLSSDELSVLLSDLHGFVRRGFVCKNDWRDEGNTQATMHSLDFWRMASSLGWNDGYANFDTWEKPEGGPVINFNWLADWSKSGGDTRQIDPHSLYDTAFGDGFYDLDFVLHSHSALKAVKTVFEPMAGIANYSYYGHFIHPELTYIMSDVDDSARDRVTALPWRPNAKYMYYGGELGDVLSETAWKTWADNSPPGRLAEIRKQSYQMFTIPQLVELMRLGTTYADYLFFETLNSWGGDPKEDDNALREDVSSVIAEKIGVRIELVNPPKTGLFTDRSEMTIQATDLKHPRRTPIRIMHFDQWTLYSIQTLVLLAEDMLGLKTYYLTNKGRVCSTQRARLADLPDDESLLYLMFSRQQLADK